MQWRMDTWRGVDRIYESNQAFKISNKDKEYSFHDSSDFTISGMPTLLVLDQMQTGLCMFKPQIFHVNLFYAVWILPRYM